MPAKHARLSASASNRWLACPGSLLLEDLYEPETSVFAEEGTQAHAVCETLLKRELFETSLDVGLLSKADVEMAGHAQGYVDYCMDIYDALTMKDNATRAFVEQRIDYSDYAPKGFGTSDFYVVGAGELHTVDYKYGKGVPVSAKENSQQRLYALGALKDADFLYDIEKIVMHIYQPRLNNISTETISKTDLLWWGEVIVKPRADKAHKGTKEYSSGKHCMFCRARATCKTRANKLLNSLTELLGGKE